MPTLTRMLYAMPSIPVSTGWLLADLGEYKGRQELYTRQMPERLESLKEFALIESAVSSNRIEGIDIDHSRVKTVVFGHAAMADRNEEEIRGYRKALDLIHSDWKTLDISEQLIQQLHDLSRGDIWDAGRYKAKDGDIIQTYADGRSRVWFKTAPANETPGSMKDLIQAWDLWERETSIHPLINDGASG